MQEIKVYILIEDEENKSEVRIDGNLETLRTLLEALRAEFTVPAIVAQKELSPV